MTPDPKIEEKAKAFMGYFTYAYKQNKVHIMPTIDLETGQQVWLVVSKESDKQWAPLAILTLDPDAVVKRFKPIEREEPSDAPLMDVLARRTAQRGQKKGGPNPLEKKKKR